MIPGMNVLQAISSAGGLDLFGKQTKILILRNENGQQVRLAFNYKDVINGRAPRTKYRAEARRHNLRSVGSRYETIDQTPVGSTCSGRAVSAACAGATTAAASHASGGPCPRCWQPASRPRHATTGARITGTGNHPRRDGGPRAIHWRIGRCAQSNNRRFAVQRIMGFKLSKSFWNTRMGRVQHSGRSLGTAPHGSHYSFSGELYWGRLYRLSEFSIRFYLSPGRNFGNPSIPPLDSET